MANEKRKLKRRHLIYYLTVLEKDTDRVIGFLVDITTNGIMIMSEFPIKNETVLHLKVLLQTEMSKKEYMHFDAKSVWCERSINGYSYDTGLELLDVDPKDFSEIEKIITELGFND